MSITSCEECGDLYDSDYQMEVNEDGDCICNKCWEKLGKPIEGRDDPKRIFYNEPI